MQDKYNDCNIVLTLVPEGNGEEDELRRHGTLKRMVEKERDEDEAGWLEILEQSADSSSGRERWKSYVKVVSRPWGSKWIGNRYYLNRGFITCSISGVCSSMGIELYLCSQVLITQM